MFVEDANLGPVSLVGVNGQNINDPSDCPGGLGVVDKTNLQATLQPGSNYTLKFQVTTCGEGFQRLAYAHIDFNSNDVYDPSELIGAMDVDNRVDPYNVAFNFRVPCLGRGSSAGVTRLRVFVVQSGELPTDPCKKILLWGCQGVFHSNRQWTLCRT